MTTALRPIDADSHYYETRDCCTRYLEPRFRERAVRVDDRERILVGEPPFSFLADWRFDVCARPGALRELLRQKRYEDNGDAEGSTWERPSAILRRHLFVSPYHEQDVVALAGQIGASQVLFGSDWPHPEGLAEPARFEDVIAALPAAERALVMRGNAARLLGRA